MWQMCEENHLQLDWAGAKFFCWQILHIEYYNAWLLTTKICVAEVENNQNIECFLLRKFNTRKQIRVPQDFDKKQTHLSSVGKT